MKPASFRYHDPRSLDEALELRANMERSTLLAGGQSLLPLLNMRAVRCDDLIDLRHLTELQVIEVEECALVVGAMVRQRDVERSKTVQRRCPLMVEALGYVGFVQTRTRGTVGGSLAYLDPAAELVAVANAMDATLEMTSRGGVRHVPFQAYARSGFQADIRADELLTAVRFPLWPEGHGFSFHEIAPRQGGPTIVGSAALLTVDTDGMIDRVAIALAGLSDAPVRGHTLEQALLGQKPEPTLLRQAADLIAEHAAVDSIHAPKRVRQRLAVATTARALEQAVARVKGPQHG